MGVVGNWPILGRKSEQNEQKGCLPTNPVRGVVGKRFFAPSGSEVACAGLPTAVKATF